MSHACAGGMAAGGIGAATAQNATPRIGAFSFMRSMWCASDVRVLNRPARRRKASTARPAPELDTAPNVAHPEARRDDRLRSEADLHPRIHRRRRRRDM